MRDTKRSIFALLWSFFFRERRHRERSAVTPPGTGLDSPSGLDRSEDDGEGREPIHRPRKERQAKFTRILALALMAVATLGSAWGGFQAGLWSGIQTFRLADAMKLSRLSLEDSVLSVQQQSFDAVTFMDFAQAVSENNLQLADFIRARSRLEFRPALDAWLATKPLKNKNAPPSPFGMAEYKLKAQTEAAKQDRLANAKYAEAQSANLNGDRYTLAILLFTSSLFLAGLITGFDDIQIRWIAAVLSLIFICGATLIAASLPIAHLG